MNPSVIGIDVSLTTIDAFMITAFPEDQHHIHIAPLYPMSHRWTSTETLSQCAACILRAGLASSSYGSFS